MTRLARSALIVAIFFALEKLLGFLRAVLIARQFGLSKELDAFNAANNVPDLLFALISGGALAIAFIPVLSEYLETKSRPAAWDLFSRIANLVFLVTAGFSLLIAIAAHPIVRWRLGIAPGFDTQQQILVANLMRLDLIATLLFSLSGLVIAGLQANQHFFLPALAPSMYDVGMLFGVLVLSPQTPYRFGPIQLPHFGMGVFGLAYGAILGGVLFFIVQIPGLVRYHFHWTPAVDLRHPGVRQVLALLGPRVMTVFFIQLVFLAQDNIASRISVGAVSALVYGWLFMQVPESLIGTAIGTVLLPTISEQVARHEQEAFRSSLNRALRVLLSLTLPSAALLAIVIRPAVGILGLNSAGTDLVVWTTRAFLVGLVGHSLLEVAVRAFYAQQNARIPLLASALTTTIFIVLAWLLSSPLGVAGIALANSIAYSGEALLLWVLLSRRFAGLFQLQGALLRAALVALGAAILVALLMRLPLPALPLAIGALAIGGLSVLPFIWPEVRLLVRL